MTRQELLDGLRKADALIRQGRASTAGLEIAALITDIEHDGVLDVQYPSDIAESMGIPRPV